MDESTLCPKPFVISRAHLRKRSQRTPRNNLEVPDLLRLQHESFGRFLKKNANTKERENSGLHAVFKENFPITSYSGNISLDYLDYAVGEPSFLPNECKKMGFTYSVPLKVKFRVQVKESDESGEEKVSFQKVQDVFFGEIPFMTERGTFVVNGTERVVVFQLYRAPGVYFEGDKGRNHSSKKVLYSSRIISSRGSWLDFEFDYSDIIYARVDRRRKFPATVILKALGMDEVSILNFFFEQEIFSRKDGSWFWELQYDRLRGFVSDFDLYDKDEKCWIRQGKKVTAKVIADLRAAEVQELIIPDKFMCDHTLADEIVDHDSGEVLFAANTKITEEVLRTSEEHFISEIKVIYVSETGSGPYISDTLRLDGVDSQKEALEMIYRVLRPGEPPTREVTERLFRSLFFSIDRYFLSRVGRFKLNSRLGVDVSEDVMHLTEIDILSTLKVLVAVRDGRDSVDDIDHLGNRRVRGVGEMIENQVRAALLRVARAVRERLGVFEEERLKPQELINSKIVVSAIREFFCSDPRSQFMEQGNALAALVHGRRITSLGPGGVSQEHAGFEIRDVHQSYMGVICPIETPEGPNIGLINSLALYATVDSLGFLSAPLRVVENRKITDKVVYLSAAKMPFSVISQADLAVDKSGLIIDEYVICRYKNEVIRLPSNEVEYVDASPNQIVSVAASLIPFLENDDTSRVLMGANMNRQSLSVLYPEAPLVGTGMEETVGRSGACLLAEREGKVVFVDSMRAVIRNESDPSDIDVDVYEFTKYGRSNSDTSINHKPVIFPSMQVREGDLLADGAGVNKGELALGANVLVAFMSWNGYSFEDSIVISSRIVEDEVFTSIHIRQFTCIAREGQNGPDEITADVPGIAQANLASLDESGIVVMGSHVESGDIIVGKVTPKGEVQLTPEEKLLRAIFGAKASHVSNTSLCVPEGCSGTVIDVQILIRDGVEKDTRSLDIEERHFDRAKKSAAIKRRLREKYLTDEINTFLIGKKAKSGPKRKGSCVVDQEYLSILTNLKRFEIKLEDPAQAKELSRLKKRWVAIQNLFKKEIAGIENRTGTSNEFVPGVLKIVKVRIGVKRKLRIGDKMAGRHGNKGVVSRIVPVADMPCLEDGRPIDVILNPLGVPSRMNIGQVLETHLGWAAQGLGKKLGILLRKRKAEEIRSLLQKIYEEDSEKLNIISGSDDDLFELAQSLENGVPFASPVFDGITEERVKSLLELADLPKDGKMVLVDGKTGERFLRPVTVGCMYMMKLNHLVDDKMHARSTGPYSLVTQQPLSGKAQFGGQRFGEMEVWALEGYGAANMLQEFMTTKSDDVKGRAAAYAAIVEGSKHDLKYVPESLKVAVRELNSLAINVQVISADGHEEPIYSLFSDDEERDTNSISALQISIASPSMIKSWSFGEVRRPETINYRTGKPELWSLFCGVIFGPIKDYECLCGKYKRFKSRGVICEKCGVEVTLSKVRRVRMGHIELACPVAHIWFLRSLPSKIGLTLNMGLRDIERVLYFESYLVTDPGNTDLFLGQLLTDDEYLLALEEYGDIFEANMGAEAVRSLLEKIDLVSEIKSLREDLQAVRADSRKLKIRRRLRILEAFHASNIRPEWMILTVLPVLPPDLRPLVPLDGGRFATSDLNDLYRRVINRNNRLLRLLELNAPSIIVRNEKRMLQEAVDALFDNGRRGRSAMSSNGIPLKSLSDALNGKEGRFRQNILGKRVDYSGRSVIVVGPNLKLHQCGLPKKMALELFKPFVFRKLKFRGLIATMKAGKRMLENEDPIVWEILAEVIHEHPVLLNRAPTLHRLGIQAFEPILVEGKAIRLHPLVCTAFNADFDGDQMAVHVPLSTESQLEARILMMSTNNILSPQNGRPIINPTQDIVLGLYYMTRSCSGLLGEGMVFADSYEVVHAYETGKVALHAHIKVRIEKRKGDLGHVTLVETTVGRVLVWVVLPDGINYDLINRVLDKKEISNLMAVSCQTIGMKGATILADQLMYTGFKYATLSGISIGIDDFIIPSSKKELVMRAKQELAEVQKKYSAGLITQGEKKNIEIDTWSNCTEMVSSQVMAGLSVEMVRGQDNKLRKEKSFNSVYIMADSGARSSSAQISQIAGVRGLMVAPTGEIIPTPIEANFREGLCLVEYFISTHGARKGLADVALKTANSGYLTRRLVDVSQDMVVTNADCGTSEGILMSPVIEGGTVLESLGDLVFGRVTAGDVRDAITDQLLLEGGKLIGEKELELISKGTLDSIKVRTPITCKTEYGVCSMCYGRDLARGALINIGEAVGIIAAQSIGEPGTQLTMRTFHVGGAASKVTVNNSIQVKSSGKIRFVNMRLLPQVDGNSVSVSRSGELVVVSDLGREKERYKVPYGAQLFCENHAIVKQGDLVASWDPYSHPIITEVKGHVKFVDIIEGATVRHQVDPITGLGSLIVSDPMQQRRESEKRSLKPMIKLLDDNGEPIGLHGTSVTAQYFLPTNAIIAVEDGAVVHQGDLIAKIPQEGSKTRDITGGLPRVTDLFEARVPKNPAVLAEIAGIVNFGKETKGKKRLVITGIDGQTWEVLIPKWRSIMVFEGEQVAKGEFIVDGQPILQDLLRLLGIEKLASYLIREVQEVYRLQGVQINNKHIEIILAQMTRKVSVTAPGDSSYLIGDLVEKSKILKENALLREQGGEEISFQGQILGITKAALLAESFISAASFQETTKVLSEAAIAGKRDSLAGLKENVALGKLIPAGTGLIHRKISRKNDKS